MSPRRSAHEIERRLRGYEAWLERAAPDDPQRGLTEARVGELCWVLNEDPDARRARCAAEKDRVES